VVYQHAVPFVSWAAATFDHYAGMANDFPFEERATPDEGRVRAAGPRAGRCGRSDHRVETGPGRADREQGRTGAAGRLHRRAEVLPGGGRVKG